MGTLGFRSPGSATDSASFLDSVRANAWRISFRSTSVATGSGHGRMTMEVPVVLEPLPGGGF